MPTEKKKRDPLYTLFKYDEKMREFYVISYNTLFLPCFMENLERELQELKEQGRPVEEYDFSVAERCLIRAAGGAGFLAGAIAEQQVARFKATPVRKRGKTDTGKLLDELLLNAQEVAGSWDIDKLLPHVPGFLEEYEDHANGEKIIRLLLPHEKEPIDRAKVTLSDRLSKLKPTRKPRNQGTKK